MEKSDCYFSESLVDHEIRGVEIPGSWREHQDNLIPLEVAPHVRNPAATAKVLRDRFAEYFVESGRVEWQDNIL